MERRMIISKMLVEARGERTQREVAKDLGLATSTIAMYERGERVPKDEIKIKLADYYGMTVQELFF